MSPWSKSPLVENNCSNPLRWGLQYSEEWDNRIDRVVLINKLILWQRILIYITFNTSLVITTGCLNLGILFGHP